MEKQFEYLAELSNEFNPLARDPDLLYQKLNNLDKDDLRYVFVYYNGMLGGYGPVNFLRAISALKF